MQKGIFTGAKSAAAVILLTAVACPALEKELSLLTRQPMGELAVAGRLSIDLHAEFMASRSYGTETVLNWYNCGYSGGGGQDGRLTGVGGAFGDFGFQVPQNQREEVYPHAITVGEVRAIHFDGNDFLKGNFAVEERVAGQQAMALEVWFRSQKRKKGEVLLGWQSRDGRKTSAPLMLPDLIKESDKWRHLVVSCREGQETWYLDGEKVAAGKRRSLIDPGHIPVLGGASEKAPSFIGELAAVRLHDQAMTDEEVAHNFKGGVMLGTEMHNWWRTEPGKWWVQESAHFRHCVDRQEMQGWSQRQMDEFNERVPRMFNMAELIYHTYSERLALRSSVVSVKPEERGDGIKYKTPIQPSQGSWMGWDGHFGWACQGAGHINPHELAHGWSAMTGSMQGNYWEAFANWPQTYNGIYQTIPVIIAECSAFPASGRTYYHDRLMFEHLAHTPEYGPMFIAKMWYDGRTENEKDPYPWKTFTRLDPDPKTPLAYEQTRMVQRNVTWDYTTYSQAGGGEGNTPYGNDAVVSPENIYRRTAESLREDVRRLSRILLERIPYNPEWWRVPKEQAPQQLGWNICPLTVKPGTVSATLQGYVNPERGSFWSAAFVGVDAQGEPVYGDVFEPGRTQSFKVTADMRELYLAVCAVPSEIMAINMVGDFRSFEQEQFPYMVKFKGCEPLDILLADKPGSNGKAHSNGGGYVESTARVEPTAYVGPHAQVLGNSQVLGNARIEDLAVVKNGIVKDNAVVSGHALVTDGSTVAENARVRDFAVVKNQTTVRGNAKILEHAVMNTRKTCAYNVVVKGVASVYGGNQGGSAMIDGFYAKGNEITGGKWFTWSWGQGRNPGETDENFSGLYADYTFDRVHPWMAWDDFGVTWGYLVNQPLFEAVTDGRAEPAMLVDADPATNYPAHALVLNGRDQFVELPKDVADMGDCTYTIVFKGKVFRNGARLFEFGSESGDAVWLSPSEKGRLVFAIRKGQVVQQVSAPAPDPGTWTTVQVVREGPLATLIVNGRKVAENPRMTLKPESVRPTQCYLGRGLKGDWFDGKIDRFTIHSVPLFDSTAPTPDPAVFKTAPQMISPSAVALFAERGTDPLGLVEYYFEQEDGRWNSGWTKDTFVRVDTKGVLRPPRYRVRMRDAHGNQTSFSAFTTPVKLDESATVTVSTGAPAVIEAEKYLANVAALDAAAAWEKQSGGDGFVGEGYMVVPDRGMRNEPFASTAAHIDYAVNFTRAGRYYLWVRANGNNDGGQAIHAGFGLQVEEWGRYLRTGHGRYSWTRAPAFQIDTAGARLFSIWMCEDGAMVDRFLFTADENYEPDPAIRVQR